MNDIVIAVDTANTGSTTDETFSLVSPEEGKSGWLLDGSSLSDKIELTLYANRPKRAGNFQGVIRSGIKVTEGVTVPGVNADDNLVATAIANVSFATPEGTPEAVCVRIRQRLIAMLDNDTFMKDLSMRATAYPSVS